MCFVIGHGSFVEVCVHMVLHIGIAHLYMYLTFLAVRYKFTGVNMNLQYLHKFGLNSADFCSLFITITNFVADKSRTKN